MDPSVGNTGGLVGVDGIRYALGEGTPDIVSRPLPLALGRWRKKILSPITKIDADEFVLTPSEQEERKKASLLKEEAAAAKKRILDQAQARIEKTQTEKIVPEKAPVAQIRRPEPPQSNHQSNHQSSNLHKKN